MKFDRKLFFDSVRPTLFGGKLSQQQVDGMNDILTEWETDHSEWDLRWLAYALATTKHETASTMWPIEEYGKGKGQPYGVPDPKTGFAYYGRGFVQLTWGDNYEKADLELNLTGDLSTYWHPSRALDPAVAADIMFLGMYEGWFRNGKRFSTYFNSDTDDPVNAREIINGDKTYKPSWAGGKTIGSLIAGYHKSFLGALKIAQVDEEPVVAQPKPQPVPEEPSSRNLDELWDLVQKIAVMLGLKKDKPNA